MKRNDKGKKKDVGVCKTCGITFLYHAWHTKGLYCSTSCSAKAPRSDKWKIAMANTKGENNPFFGKRHSKETIEKIAYTKVVSPLTVRGEKSPFWKGGVTGINKKIRSSAKLKKWRRDVFHRDDYTCQMCKVRGCELHADHIKPFALFPELRFVLSNGRTLCVPCHKQTPTYLGKIKTYEKELFKI